MSKKGGCNRCCCALAVFLSLAIAASDSAQVTLVNATTPMSSNSTMSTVTPAITPAGELDCSSRNSSCGECIGDVKCYYCYKDNTCRLYPASAVLPTAECPLSQVRWGATCRVSFEVLVIAVSVVGAVLVLALCYCCYCCCSGRGGGGGGRDYARDNRSNQMNPNNWRFWSSRGYNTFH